MIKFAMTPIEKINYEEGILVILDSKGDRYRYGRYILERMGSGDPDVGIAKAVRAVRGLRIVREPGQRLPGVSRRMHSEVLKECDASLQI